MSKFVLPGALEDRFYDLQKVGEGTYAGAVYKSYDQEDDQWAALKILGSQQQHTDDEIEILRSLSGVPYLISLYDAIDLFQYGGEQETMLVFEYMDYDLLGLMYMPGHKLSTPEIKSFMQQTLRGLSELTTRGYMHRDLKPSNLFVRKDGQLKIGDMGSATSFTDRSTFSSEVITLWYRPPELILGKTSYGPEVDIWAAACIFVELMSGQSFLRGKTEAAQMDEICSFFGYPEKPVMSEVYATLPRLPLLAKQKNVSSQSQMEPFLSAYFDPAGVDLLTSMFAWDPRRRPSARDCLSHRFFHSDPLPLQPPFRLEYQEIHGFQANTQSSELSRTNSYQSSSASTASMGIDPQLLDSQQFKPVVTSVENPTPISPRVDRDSDVDLNLLNSSQFDTLVSRKPSPEPNFGLSPTHPKSPKTEENPNSTEDRKPLPNSDMTLSMNFPEALADLKAEEAKVEGEKPDDSKQPGSDAAAPAEETQKKRKRKGGPGDEDMEEINAYFSPRSMNYLLRDTIERPLPRLFQPPKKIRPSDPQPTPAPVPSDQHPPQPNPSNLPDPMPLENPVGEIVIDVGSPLVDARASPASASTVPEKTEPNPSRDGADAMELEISDVPPNQTSPLAGTGAEWNETFDTNAMDLSKD